MPTDEAPLVPTDKDSVTPPPSEEAPLVPPFDEPPTPPKSSEPAAQPPTNEPADAPPPTTLPDPPEFPTHDSDPPPIKPDDDPFKDDPPSPADEPSKAAASDRATGADRSAEMLGHTGSRLPVAEPESASAGPRLMPTNSLEEPRRLQSTDLGVQEDHRVAPAGAPLKRNPLRAATQKGADEKVVPTAHWTKDRSAPSAAAAAGRRNPLRPN
jgi:hypothetical protein